MRLIFLVLISALSLSFAGVVKESKTSVDFSGFGKYITETSTKIQGLRKIEDSHKEFKGQGFMGSLTAKFILKPGHDASLTALDEMKLYTIDHTKNQFAVTSIEKMEYDRSEAGNDEEPEVEETEAAEEESNIRVIRNEFKVNATGEKKSINTFPCEKYIANWIFEWENTETGERGTDSLETVIWTTQLTATMQKAQQEELDFNKEYMSKIGFEMDEFYDDILGTRWMQLFSQLNQSRSEHADEKTPDFGNELKKIEGYPVVTDGNYYFIRPGQAGEQTEEETPEEESTVSNPRDVKGMFGGLMKKAMKPKEKPEKKKDKGPKSAFSFYNELIRFESKNIDQMDLTIPSGYTEVSGTN